jgi:hypothetical protein
MEKLILFSSMISFTGLPDVSSVDQTRQIAA